MPQPESWNDEERELLQSAELDGPAPDAQNRTLAALGIGGAALGSAVAVAGSAKAASLATTAPGALSTAASGGSKLLLLGKVLAVVVAAGIAGGTWLHNRRTANEPPAAVIRASEPLESPEVTAVAPPPLEAIPDVGTPPEAAPSVAKTNLAPTRTEPDIALEIESLDRARRAEGRRDFAAALRELDQYDRTFKQGRLRPEALVLRVQTLLGKGDTAGAKALGNRFLTRYPKSPLAPRIQKLIGANQ